MVSVVACSSSSSVTTSLLSSPSTSYWSRSCCSGGALGRSCFTVSRLMFGASFIRSLLRIWDLMAFNRMVLMCCRTSQVAHCSMSSGLPAGGCWCASWPLNTKKVNQIIRLQYSKLGDSRIVPSSCGNGFYTNYIPWCTLGLTRRLGWVWINVPQWEASCFISAHLFILQL